MKWGICQKKRTPKRIQPSAETPPSAADQPISGGNAPAIAPISVLHRLERFAGVYHPRYAAIVRSVKSAASLPTSAKVSMREAMHMSHPRTKADPPGILPVGIGLSAVRRIRASVSL